MDGKKEIFELDLTPEEEKQIESEATQMELFEEEGSDMLFKTITEQYGAEDIIKKLEMEKQYIDLQLDKIVRFFREMKDLFKSKGQPEELVEKFVMDEIKKHEDSALRKELWKLKEMLEKANRTTLKGELNLNIKTLRDLVNGNLGSDNIGMAIGNIMGLTNKIKEIRPQLRAERKEIREHGFRKIKPIDRGPQKSTLKVTKTKKKNLIQ